MCSDSEKSVVWTLPRDSRPVPSSLWASSSLSANSEEGLDGVSACWTVSYFRTPCADPACPGTWEFWARWVHETLGTHSKSEEGKRNASHSQSSK